jgi:L-lactate utilization protein LutC
MNKTTTNPCYAQSTSNFTFTTQSKPQSEFVYVSTSIPSAIVMISTQYQELPDKQKLELLSKLSEWTYNKTSEIINQNKQPMKTAMQLLFESIENDQTLSPDSSYWEDLKLNMFRHEKEQMQEEYRRGWDDATKDGIKEAHKYQDLINQNK